MGADPAQDSERWRCVSPIEHVHAGLPPTLILQGTRDFLVPHTQATRYAERLEALGSRPDSWWEGEARFFDTTRSKAWVVVRRIAHTAHHRGQQMTMLRMLERDLHSNYGPTADTGGLMQDDAPVIYAYSDTESLVKGETAGGGKTTLPGPGDRPVTERPSGNAGI